MVYNIVMKGKQLQRKVIKYVEMAYGGYCVNVIKASKAGVPDLICCIDGIFHGFEVKGDGDRLTKLQEHNIRQINDWGGSAGVVRSLSDVDNIVSKYTGGI